jgi:hypothetical protein
MIDGSFEVAKDALGSNPMNGSRRMQELAKLVDYKGDV